MSTEALDREIGQTEIRTTRKYGGVLEYMPAFFYRVNDRGIITECHGHGLVQMGLSQDEVVGRDITGIFPGVAGDLRQALEGSRFPLNYPARPKAGSGGTITIYRATVPKTLMCLVLPST